MDENPFNNLDGDHIKSEDAAGMPDVQVNEDEHNVYIVADLPFIDAKTIKIQYDNSNLTIKGMIEKPEEELQAEHPENAFGIMLSLHIVKNIDTQQIQARYRQGVLQITLPKKKEFKI